MNRHENEKWVIESFGSIDRARKEGSFDWCSTDRPEYGPPCQIWVRHKDGGVTGLPGRIEVFKDTAQLISAAPDMLRVLKELEECAEYWSEYDVPIGIHERINNAIMKAEGKNP